MGEVYRAQDTRLDRIVAIKVLPPQFANDPLLRERFDREARTISQLNHPHICTLHDVGHQDGVDFLVMEHLEGETLEARLARGALPFDDALRIAVQIAGALDKAHGQGIVHRDLKPGNIMLTKAGAKLLDFGLAKTAAGAAAGAGLTGLATTPPNLTGQGTILGTFQYMAPEQVEGQEADARTDIFAFGVVLYEMITGRKAFEAKSQAGLMGAILAREPTPLRTIQPSLPQDLEWAVALCIAKHPDERWQHTRDLLYELRRLSAGATGASSTAGPPKRPPLRWGVAAAALLLMAVVAGAIAGQFLRPTTSPTESLRFVLRPPPGVEVTGGPAAPQAVISPDGTRIVFSGLDSSGTAHLYVRSLDALDAQLLAGSVDGELPFWSPDGRSVAFFSADRKLKKVPTEGGVVQTICKLPGGEPSGGGTWNSDGVILFSPGPDQPLYRVPAAGGAPLAMTAVDTERKERAHLWPSFLPDGRRFLYLIQSGAGGAGGIYIGSLESKEKTRLVDSPVRAAFAVPHHLLFVREGTLFAQTLDAGNTRLTGEPVPIAERVAYNPTLGLGRAAFTVSQTGVVVYRSGGVGGTVVSQLVWFDRQGTRLGNMTEPAQYEDFDLSRDDGRVVASQYDPRTGHLDIWVLGSSGSMRQRLTFDGANDDGARWSPDGSRVAFRSDRRGTVDLYLKTVAGSAAEELLVQSPVDKSLHGWTPDGRFVIYQSAGAKTGEVLWLLPVTGDRTPRAILQPPLHPASIQVSPDGRWIAYESDDSGLRQVYVQPFPPSGAPWQVSTDGGGQPRWRRDGRELFYVSGNRLVSVDVTAGATFGTAPPRELFRLPGFSGRGYAVSSDGQRFLVGTPVEQTDTSMTVLVNWPARLKPPAR